MMAVLAFSGMAASGPITDPDSKFQISIPDLDYYQKITDRTIDPLLEQKIENSRYNDRLEILVQFYDEILTEDLQYLDKLGIDTIREFHVIPAVYGLATPFAIQLLSKYQRTYWIEYNEQLEYLMDTTTTTTNATKVWNSYITDTTGKFDEPITGKDVTVVVVDSGIDAGHPDLDYGEKVILNYKSDADGSYTSVENSDTSSGHGTHCSGTIGGNGDASAGSRRGMAPDCKIIGISTGEAVAILNALGALEWTFDHSRPNSNPYNIRVVSNSWGTNAEFNPEDSIVKVTERLTYENNVVVVFAAGNAGAEDHDGSTVTTNPYSLTPGVISVAAFLKDGSGLAYFSSRGSADDNFTWPDVGAPGFQIWATEARKTLITASVKQGGGDDAMDGYYMAISGTSMATPHVAGLTALLWDAAPSLRVSNIHDEYSGNGQFENYYNSSITLMHEAELILKLTSRYAEPDDQAMNSENDNGVPDNHSIGMLGKKYDYAQGYGFIDAEKAVALALTLEKLRFNNPRATVWDALYSYENIIQEGKNSVETNVLYTHWHGEWSYLNDGRESTVFTNHPKRVYIPNETAKLLIDLTFDPVNIPERQAGTISLTIDFNDDGSPDWQSSASFSESLNGLKHDEITVSQTGGIYNFNIIGQVLSWPIEDVISAGNPLLVGEKDFREGLIEYDVSIQLVLDVGANETTPVMNDDLHANVGWLKFGIPSPEYNEGEIEMKAYLYDLGYAEMPPDIVIEETKKESRPLWPFIILVLLILIGAWWYIRKKQNKPFTPSFVSRVTTRKPKPLAAGMPDEAGRVEKPLTVEKEKPIEVKEEA